MNFIRLNHNPSALSRGITFILYFAFLSTSLAATRVQNSALQVKQKTVIHQVNIVGFKFVPERLEVAVGDRVTWTNNDIAPHSVIISQSNTAKKGKEITPRLEPKQSFSFQVTDGINYQCGIHPSMQGKIIIQSVDKR
ncbi:MAG: cupredoxin domain-containing protein [Enterobacterales bacterium]|nr:cupredoxin domain-containing protein [Enterobacterales bacterium]